MTSTHRPEPVRVWDLFVRVFHWSLVTCILLNYFVVDDGEDLHQWLGYAATGERRPFPTDDVRFGLPRVSDLTFVVLARDLG